MNPRRRRRLRVESRGQQCRQLPQGKVRPLKRGVGRSVRVGFGERAAAQEKQDWEPVRERRSGGASCFLAGLHSKEPKNGSREVGELTGRCPRHVHAAAARHAKGSFSHQHSTNPNLAPRDLRAPQGAPQWAGPLPRLQDRDKETTERRREHLGGVPLLLYRAALLLLLPIAIR